MARVVLAVVAALVAAAPAQGTKYRRLELPELVGRTDLIVIGTATPKKITARGKTVAGCELRVTETLLGTPVEVVEFSFIERAIGDGLRLVFLAAEDGGHRLFYPFPTSANQSDAVRRLVKLKRNPAAAVIDPGVAFATDFLELRGHTFERVEKVGPLDRAGVAAHLLAGLLSKGEKGLLASLFGLVHDPGNGE